MHLLMVAASSSSLAVSAPLSLLPSGWHSAQLLPEVPSFSLPKSCQPFICNGGSAARMLLPQIEMTQASAVAVNRFIGALHRFFQK